MKYYFNKTVSGDFDNIINRVTNALKEEGFGVLTEIDIQKTLKKKLDVNFMKYTILGACNPEFAYKALKTEDKIGTMLPCNVIIQEKENNLIEVAAVNPIASMQAVINSDLIGISKEVSQKLKNVINNF